MRRLWSFRNAVAVSSRFDTRMSASQQDQDSATVKVKYGRKWTFFFFLEQKFKMMSRQMCVSQDDLILSDRDTAHNWPPRKRQYASYVQPHDSAKNRALKTLTSGHKTTASLRTCHKHCTFLKCDQTHCESAYCSYEILLRTCAELHYLFYDLSIAAAHYYPILKHISLNLWDLRAVQHDTCDRDRLKIIVNQYFIMNEFHQMKFINDDLIWSHRPVTHDLVTTKAKSNTNDFLQFISQVQNYDLLIFSLNQIIFLIWLNRILK